MLSRGTVAILTLRISLLMWCDLVPQKSQNLIDWDHRETLPIRQRTFIKVDRISLRSILLACIITKSSFFGNYSRISLSPWTTQFNTWKAWCFTCQRMMLSLHHLLTNIQSPRYFCWTACLWEIMTQCFCNQVWTRILGLQNQMQSHRKRWTKVLTTRSGSRSMIQIILVVAMLTAAARKRQLRMTLLANHKVPAIPKSKTGNGKGLLLCVFCTRFILFQIRNGALCQAFVIWHFSYSLIN